MPFSTNTCLLALACTFTSTWALAGGPPLTQGRVASLELEALLAKKPNVYLKLDLSRKLLEIKARGLALDQVPIKALEAAARKPFYLRPEPFRLALPALWEVQLGPGDTDREVIAPESLRPPRRADEEEEEPTPTPRAGQPTPTPRPELPSRYRVELTSGMLLWVTDRLPARTFFARFWEAVKEGWAFLVKGQEPPQEPPGIVLVVEAEDARRLHHLFRQGMALLLVAEGES